MSRLHQSRIDNAMRIGRTLHRLQQEGWLILDESDDVVGPIVFAGWSDNQGEPAWAVSHGPHARTIYFDASQEGDLYESVKAFNAGFSKWRAIPPGQVRSVLSLCKEAT